jgi:hypothetical protein
VLVFGLCIVSVPLPAFAKRYLFNPFQEFLTLEEAEVLSGTSLPDDAGSPGSKGTTIVLVSLALLEILLWIGVGIFEVASGTFGTGTILPVLFATSWFYAFLRPLIKNPIITAPMDLFSLFSLEFAGAVLLLGGVLFGYGNATQIMVIVLVGNVILTGSLLVVVLRLPLAVPLRKPLHGDLVGLFLPGLPMSVDQHGIFPRRSHRPRTIPHFLAGLPLLGFIL